jgi:hypothetical protein
MSSETSCWQRAEWTLTSDRLYNNALQDAQLSAVFTAPSGKAHKVYGFWDGSTSWRVRFAPDELGNWTFETQCSDKANEGLYFQDSFSCIEATGKSSFSKHGRLKVADSRTYFEHADGTPFFFLADTCWNGPLLATAEDWQYYLKTRREQKINTVQWVATQWRAAPDGDSTGSKAYEGNDERISLNLEFFKQLEAKHDAIIAAGLLSLPVLLWAIEWHQDPTKNDPGFTLPEDQAILLARYMVARWGADPVIWFLPGDANYQGDYADRWRRIGQAVFGDINHAPVTLHPNGQQWIGNFGNESWIDFLCYQSGHGDGDEYDKWLLEGPPATEWNTDPLLPIINVEPPYENHVAYQSKVPFNAHATRKRLYWSLLVHPPAGVTYGGHGVWAWDDGMGPSTAHPNSGTPLPWREALFMPAAKQLEHLYNVFTDLEWWRLRPAQSLLVEQPGQVKSEHYVLAAKTTEGDIAFVYAPENETISLDLTQLASPLQAHWFDPRTGNYQAATGTGSATATTFLVPTDEDCLLLLILRK